MCEGQGSQVLPAVCRTLCDDDGASSRIMSRSVHTRGLQQSGLVEMSASGRTMTSATASPPARRVLRQKRRGPGSPVVQAQGCASSVSANTAYRAGADDTLCVDPLRRLHAGPDISEV